MVNNRLEYWQRMFYRYDGWGNLTRRRNGVYQQHYVYDADNRLIKAHGRGPQGDFEAQYHYDALGRRTRKTVTLKGKVPETTRFVWEGYRLLQAQRDNGTRRTWSYDPASRWTPLAALEQAGDGQQADIYWLHTDLNSAPLEVTDAEGNLRWSGNYDTFGKLQGQTVAGAERRKGAFVEQPLRYAGQYQDNESGLHYNLFRYYEPEVGRFTTQDPIGLRGGLNLYRYAPNPYGWIDPLGLALAGVDFTGHPDLFPVSEGQSSIVQITMQGSRGRDFTEAYNLAGIKKSDAGAYTWHHLDDFDPATGKTTMQLVKTQTHIDSFPHKGSVAQFEHHFGVKYGTKEAISISHSKGWLQGRTPKACS